MKFNDQLHEDLFDLFIVSFMGIEASYTSESMLGFIRESKLSAHHFKHFKDLFPQQNHPEEFVIWISSGSLRDVKLIQNKDKWDSMAFAGSDKIMLERKIIITVAEEE